MASHDFQTALQNYLDLEDLRKRLVARGTPSLDAFEDVTRLRRAYYDAAPSGDRSASSASSTRRCACAWSSASTCEKRLDQHVGGRRGPSTAGDGGRASAGERSVDALRAGIESMADGGGAATGAERGPATRGCAACEGVLTWTVLETHYHERLTEAARSSEGARMPTSRPWRPRGTTAFVRARQAATCTATSDTEIADRAACAGGSRARARTLEQLDGLDGTPGPHARDRRDQRARRASGAASSDTSRTRRASRSPTATIAPRRRRLDDFDHPAKCEAGIEVSERATFISLATLRPRRGPGCSSVGSQRQRSAVRLCQSRFAQTLGLAPPTWSRISSDVQVDAGLAPGACTGLSQRFLNEAPDVGAHAGRDATSRRSAAREGVRASSARPRAGPCSTPQSTTPAKQVPADGAVLARTRHG